MTITVNPRPDEGRILEAPVKALTLAALPSAASSMRMFVWHVLGRDRTGSDYAQRIETVAEELVIHAVAATGVTLDAPLYAPAFDCLGVIEVGLQVASDRAVIEVRDQTTNRPHPEMGASAAIMDADDWGYTLLPGGWRAVWCVVTADKPSTPRVPVPDQRFNPDTQTLLRALDGPHRRV